MEDHVGHKTRLAVSIVLLVFAVACVSSSEGRRMRQDIEALDARFAELSVSNSEEREQLNDLLQRAEVEIGQLQQALEQAQGILQRSSADLGMQMDQYGREIQEVRGRVEHLEFRFEQLQEQLTLFMEDVDMRLNSR